MKSAAIFTAGYVAGLVCLFFLPEWAMRLIWEAVEWVR